MLLVILANMLQNQNGISRQFWTIFDKKRTKIGVKTIRNIYANLQEYYNGNNWTDF